MLTGMNSDLSKFIQNNDKYLKGLNVRPVTEFNGSNGALTNVRGNQCDVQFPDLLPVYKLYLYKSYFNGVFLPGQSITITINGYTTTPFNITEGTNTQQIVALLQALPNCYTGTYNASKVFAVGYDDEYITIYQNPEYNLCAPISPTSINISLEQVHNDLALYLDSTLKCLNADGDIVTMTNTVYNQTWVPVPHVLTSNISDGITVIGSTFINDVDYLYTCNYNNPYKTGQIWSLHYSEQTEITTLKLLYFNYLNFSVNFPIAPTATLGRYETPSIQRIYWTDFNNYVRTCNVADPNLMISPIELFNMLPSIQMTRPTLKEVKTGAAVSALKGATTYQCVYKLFKNNGSQTNFSIALQQVIPLDLDTATFKGANGGKFSSIAASSTGTSINKSITWEINDVDTNYDTVKFYVLIRSNDTPETYDFFEYEEAAVTSPTITTEFKNDPDKLIRLDISEFLIEDGALTHCKTIEQKDNYLFFGNTRTALSQYIHDFDTRAFRHGFSGSSQNNKVRIISTEGNTNYTEYTINSPLDYNQIPLDQDNISLFNLGFTNSDNPLYDNTFKYQSDGNTIGGSGENISYKFGAILLASDTRGTFSNVYGNQFDPPSDSVIVGQNQWGTDRDLSASTQIFKHGYRQASGTGGWGGVITPYFQNGSTDQKYYTQEAKMTLGLEYYQDLFRSYQRNEIYRFAIVFKSKFGNSSFAKWIGDIKFPDYGDSLDPAMCYTMSTTMQFTSVYGPPDFRSMWVDGKYAWSVVPFIRFTVTIPTALADLISGYEIVRVKREISDRTVMTQGLINQVVYGVGTTDLNGISSNDTYFLPRPDYSDNDNDGFSSGDSYLNPIITDGTVYNNRATTNLMSFESFDFKANFADTNAVNNLLTEDDKVIIVERYNSSTVAGLEPSGDLYVTSAPGTIIPTARGTIVNGSALQNDFTYRINKYYNIAEPPTLLDDANAYRIWEAKPVSTQGLITFSKGAVNGQAYRNHSYAKYSNAIPTTFSPKIDSIGTTTTILNMKDSFNWPNYFVPSPGETNKIYGHLPTYNFDQNYGTNKLLAIYCKPNSLKTQYGGRTFFARSKNEYVSTGAFYKVNEAGTTNIDTFGGDIFAGVLDVQKAIKAWNLSTFAPDSLYGGSGPFEINQTKRSVTFYFPHQSSLNVDLRTGLHVNADLDVDDGTKASFYDEYGYYKAYSFNNESKVYLPQPYLYTPNNIHINRVHWSVPKINGATTDEWSTIPINSYYDIDGNYGAITALIDVNRNMYAIQENATALLQINPVALTSNQDGLPLKLGTSTGVLEKHFYLSIGPGTQHQWSVYRSPSAFTFLDIKSNKIYLCNGQELSPISDVAGLRGILNKVLRKEIRYNDNPILNKGVLTTYDYKNNEFLYTFAGIDDNNLLAQYTIAYSDLINAFSSFYSFTPYIYINNLKTLYTPFRTGNWNNFVFDPANPNYDYYIPDPPATKIFRHNVGSYGSFYGTTYPSEIKVLINPSPANTKVFDNLQWSTQSNKLNKISVDDFLTLTAIDDDIPFPLDTFTAVRIYNQYQNTDWLNTDLTPVTGNLRKLEQSFNLQMPRNKFNYDTTPIDTMSLFNPSGLTKTSFGERIRDKYIIVDLSYNNQTNNNFIINYIKSLFRISDR